MMKKYLSIFFSVFLLLGIIFSSYFLGVNQGSKYFVDIGPQGGLLSAQEMMPTDVDFSSLWKIWRLVEENHVNGFYGDEKEGIDKLTNEEKVWGMIDGLLYSLRDPYTIFLPPEERKQFEEEIIGGSFGGIGIEMGVRNGELMVISPLKDSPAERVGIISGDIIIGVNDESILNLNTDQVSRKIKGEVGTKVELIIKRGDSDKYLTFEIIRETINIPVMDAEFLDNGIFLIKLYNFSPTAVNHFRQASREFLQKGGNKMIVDLRNNAGGFLESAIDITSLYLPVGRTILREVKKDPSHEKIYRSYGYDVFKSDLELVILINGGSASASEIMAGALSEHGLATLIGEQTFGKGSVQELVQIDKETSLKYTIARWLTPNGLSISQNGLKPDLEVELSLEDWENNLDPQLESAINYLLNN